MLRKLIAIVLAVLINVAVLAWFHTWSTSVVANATPPSRTDKTLILPTITVYPTRAQIRSLGRAPIPAGATSVVSGGNGDAQALVMPYYSFANDPAAAGAG